MEHFPLTSVAFLQWFLENRANVNVMSLNFSGDGTKCILFLTDDEKDGIQNTKTVRQLKYYIK